MFATAEDRQPIRLAKLTDLQADYVESVPFFLEAWPDDPDRLRTVWPTIGQAGRWFSREWPKVSWDFFKPSVGWSGVIPSSFLGVKIGARGA
jgi:hypothetical protein